MAITAERNKKGAFTGTFIVEVWRNGRMFRRRTKDGDEAKAIEKAFKAGIDLPAISVFTVGDLRREAAILWHDTKDEAQSLARFDEALRLLGHKTAIDEIRTRQLDALVATLRVRGLGNKTINRYLAVVSKALKWAVRRDLLASMPLVPRQPEAHGPPTHHGDAHRGTAWAHRRANRA